MSTCMSTLRLSPRDVYPRPSLISTHSLPAQLNHAQWGRPGTEATVVV